MAIFGWGTPKRQYGEEFDYEAKQIELTPEQQEVYRQTQQNGWNPDSQIISDGLERVATATETVVGSKAFNNPQMAAKYTPNFINQTIIKNQLKAQSNAAKMTETLEAFEVMAASNADLLSPDNYAQLKKMSDFSGITIEELQGDTNLRKYTNNAMQKNIKADKYQRAVTLMRANAGNLGLGATAWLMQDAGRFILTMDEFDAMMDTEMDNRNIVSLYYRQGVRQNAADKALAQAYANYLSTGNSEQLAEARALQARAAVEASMLPDTGRLMGFVTGAAQQIGMWVDAGLGSMIGAGVGGAVGSLLGPVGTARGAAIGKQFGGFQSNFRMIAGSTLNSLENIRDRNGELVQIDDDIKMAVATVFGGSESLIETALFSLASSSLTSVVTGNIKKSAINAASTRYAKKVGVNVLAKSPVARRAVQMLGKNALGVGLSDFVWGQTMFALEEMAEEGFQGDIRLAGINLAVKLQNKRNGGDIDFNYAGVGDYIDTFRDEAMESFQALFLMGIPGSMRGGINAYNSVAMKNKTHVNAGHGLRMTYDKLFESAQKHSVIVERSPELMREWLNKQVRDIAGEGGETVFVPAATLINSVESNMADVIDRQSFYNRFNTNIEEITESSITGADIRMDIGDIATLAIEMPEIGNALRDAMKITPDGIAYAESESSKTGYERMNKEITRTFQTILDDGGEMNELNTIGAPAEAFAAITQTPEAIVEVANELGIDPITFQQDINEGNYITFNRRRIDNGMVGDQTYLALRNSLSETEGALPTAEVLQSLDTNRQGIGPNVDIVNRASSARIVGATIEGQLNLIGVKKTEAKEVGNIMAAYFDKRSLQVNMTPQEYHQAYGNIEFVSEPAANGGQNIYINRIAGENSRGAIQIGEKIKISLTPNANASTLVHEIGHFFLFDMDRLAENMADSDIATRLVADRDVVRKWLGWQEGQEIWTTEQHEKFADGFLLYLKEGKTNTPGLKNAFRRFKRWLADFYSQWFEEGETLSPEVQDIFANLLEIEDAAIEAMDLHGIRHDGYGGFLADMSTGERQTIESVYQIKENITAQQFAERDRLLGADITDSETYKKAYETAETQIRSERLFDIAELFYKHKDERLNEASVRELLSDEDFSQLPRFVYDKDGAFTADEKSLSAGYADGSDLLSALIRLPDVATFDEMVALEANQRALVALSATEATPLSNAERVEMGLGNKNIFNATVAMREAPMRSAGRLSAAQIKAESEMIKRNFEGVAQNHVQNMNMSKLDMKLRSWAVAEARARQEYTDAMRTGDYDRALNAADRAAVNVAMSRAAKLAIKERDKYQRKINNIKQMTRTKKKWKMREDYVGHIQGILATSGFLRQDQVRATVGSSLEQFVGALAADTGLIVPIEGWLITGNNPSSYMTVNLLKDVHNAVVALQKYGRDEQRNVNENIKGSIASKQLEIINQGNMVYGSTIERSKARAQARAQGNLPDTATKAETFLGKLRQFGYGATRLENQCSVIDGYNTKFGPTYTHIYEGLRNAASAEQIMTTEFGNKTHALFSNLLKDKKAEQQFKKMKKQYGDINGVKMTDQERLIKILYTGTTSGKESVIGNLNTKSGEGTTTDQHITNLRNTMTMAEIEFCNGMWAMMDEVYDHAAAHHYNETGTYMKKEMATAFTVIPTDSTTGEAVLLTGGYFPIQYDPNSKVSRAYRDNVNAKFGSSGITDGGGFNSSSSAAMTKQTMMPGYSPGYTVARSVRNDKVASYALPSDFSVLGRHISEVAHEVTHRKACREAFNIIKSPEVAAMIENAFSYEFYKDMQNNVQEAWGSSNESHTLIDGILKTLRVNASFASIAYNASSALNQTLSLPTAAAHVGATRLMRSIGSWAFTNGSDWQEARNEALGKSALLAARERGHNVSIREYMSNHAGLIRDPSWRARNFGPFAMATLMDANTSYIIWTAAYNQGLDKGQGEAGAIRYADAILRKTQDMPDRVDASRWQSTNEFSRMMSMFYSASGAVFNDMWERSTILKQDNATKGQVFGAFLFHSLKMVAYTGIMSSALRGELPGNDDEDETDGWDMAFWASSMIFDGITDVLPFYGGFSRGGVKPPALKLFDAVYKTQDLIVRGAEDWMTEGADYAFAQAFGWQLSLGVSEIIGYSTGRWAAISFNRILRTVRDSIENEGADIYSIADALYYNKWRDVFSSEQ